MSLHLHIPADIRPEAAEAHAHRVVAAGDLVAELVVALREAREYVEDDLRQLLRSYCRRDAEGGAS